MKAPSYFARGLLGDALLAVHVRDVHEADPALGSRRVHDELTALGIHTSRKRVIRIMRTRKLKGAAEARKPVQSLVYASRRVRRRAIPARLDLVWAGDTTQVETREGWLYLTVWIDLRSRYLVGWALSTSNDTALALAALNDAIRTRKPARGLIVHTDRGSPFAAVQFADALDARGFVQSMSRRGNCHDNAAVESFFSGFKRETGIKSLRDEPRAVVRARAVEYLAHHYNARRKQTRLGKLAPAMFERLPEADQTALLREASKRAAKQRRARIEASKRRERRERSKRAARTRARSTR
jgi:transposase InsO family protein